MLHLKRFCGDKNGDVVFMLHGAVENGGIFYSDNNKGLAPYLAKRGFDVYVADLRGRGKSYPAISQDADYGQTESICEELPQFFKKIIELRGEAKQHWIAHSWGGVLLNAYLARFPNAQTRLCSLVYFGSKRQVKVKSLRRFFVIDVIWRGYCWLLAKRYGHLPAKRFRLGSDSETRKSHRQSVEWVTGLWVDSDDGFDYCRALKNRALPPTLYFAGKKDHVLGHVDDVRRFMQESGCGLKKLCFLSRKNHFKHDYNHINMLVHTDAEIDHFREVTKWLKSYQQPLEIPSFTDEMAHQDA